MSVTLIDEMELIRNCFAEDGFGNRGRVSSVEGRQRISIRFL